MAIQVACMAIPSSMYGKLKNRVQRGQGQNVGLQASCMLGACMSCIKRSESIVAWQQSCLIEHKRGWKKSMCNVMVVITDGDDASLLDRLH